MLSSKIFTDFFNSEKSSGFILIGCAILSLALTNSAWGDSYLSVWNIQFAGHSVTHWINDGLMTIFFLLVGLEIEREIYTGELKNIRNAMLPVFAAAAALSGPTPLTFILSKGTFSRNAF